MTPLATFLLVAALAPAADPVGAPAPWPFDELTLSNGAVLRGLLLADTPAGVRFQAVRRDRGRPTVTATWAIARDEVAGLKRVSDADRAVLRQKLADLDPTGAGERDRMDAFVLENVPWLGRPGAGRRYQSDQFVLVSGAGDEITRRAAVRLELVYAAYARFLPPRVRPAGPTTVLLAGDAADYRTLVGPDRGPVLNPAVYDPGANRVVCGSDLRRLGDELHATRLHHGQQLAGIAQYEADVRLTYKAHPAERDRHLAAAGAERDRIWGAERRNDAAFGAATGRLFALLYHEAFHAYAGTAVYPPRSPAEVRAGNGTGGLPRWVNEGLAQVFETAVVEAGELRVGHADPDRLDRVQALLKLKPGGLLSMAELLRAGPGAFLAAHGDQRAAADRAYLSAWAAVHYLLFGRGLVGGPNFEAFLVAVNGGADPAGAFAAWVGQDLPAFEAGLHDYLGRLLPDGTLRPPAAGAKP